MWEVIRLVPGYDPFRDAAGFYFDAEAAARACSFFEVLLTHVKGALAAKPLVLERWQKALVANLFGWKSEADGLRRFREVLLYVPRKNGKTTLAAGLALLLLVADGEPGAEVYCCAADAEQAGILFSVAKYQVLREPVLMDAVGVFQRNITVERTGSFFRAISAEADTKHGYNGHGIIVDELHAQPDRELVDVLKTSTGSREQPVVVYITTADYEREGSICNETHEYACRVRDGQDGFRDAAFLPVIYEASKEDDWTSPEVWKKANPNLGISVKYDYVSRGCLRAQNEPQYENTFKRLHLNIRTEQAMRWIQMKKWDNCAVEVDLKMFEGCECYAGLDLSSTRDVTAFVLIFPDEDEERRVGTVVPFFWVPRARAEQRSKEDKVPYTTWIRQGFLRTAGEEAVNHDQIFREMIELSERFKIRTVAYDPWQAETLAQALDRKGWDVVKFPQSYANYNAPSKEFERMLMDGRLRQDGNPVMRWMATNVMAKENEGCIRPSKKLSSDKIDGIVGLVMALGAWMTEPEKKKSVYETREVFIL